jgi:hypothetical protein
MVNPAFKSRLRGCLAGAAVALAFFRAGPEAQTTRLDLDVWLDRYAAGQHDDVLKQLGSLTHPQVRSLRSALVSTGHRWIHDVPDELPFRILAAAAFTLELEALRMEKGEWAMMTGPDQCTGRCTIEWACTVLRARGAGDDPERLWHRATFALVGGVRDWSFLLTPLSPPTPRTRPIGHVLHALSRFPGDPHVRLARAIAIASRHSVADEMDAPRPDQRTQGAPVMPMRPMIADLLSARTSTSLDYAVQQFMPLIDDPAVGPEARMRLGYLYFRGGLYEQASVAERLAAQATGDMNLRYVSYFIAAQAVQAAGDLAGAEELYAKALEARPNSQSATIALSALLFLRGDASTAYDAIERSRLERPNDDDPWRQFLYPHYPELPALIAQLRKSVTR